MTTPAPRSGSLACGYSVALANVSEAMRKSPDQVPTDILASFCAAIAPSLDFTTAVVIGDLDGPPRSLQWKREDVTSEELARAEERAWDHFASLSAPLFLDRLPTDEHGHYWTARPLAVPLYGVFYGEMRAPIGPTDQHLVKYMVARLSLALYRSHITATTGRW